MTRAFSPCSPSWLVLCNEHCLTKRDHAEILRECPRNVYVKRAKSGWMNVETLRILLECLVTILRPYKESHQVILFLDAARCHLNASIAEYCARSNIFLIILPARLTWLLQPCDTRLFAKYKRALKQKYHEIANESAMGVVDTVALFRCVFHTIRTVIQGQRWSFAFAADGFSGDTQALSSYIMRSLQYSAVPRVEDAPPDHALFSLCYPKNTKVPSATLLRPFRAQARQLAVQVPQQLALPAPSGTERRPRGTRLFRSAISRAAPRAQQTGGGASSGEPWPGLAAAMQERQAMQSGSARSSAAQPRQQMEASQGASAASEPALPWTLRSRH